VAGEYLIRLQPPATIIIVEHEGPLRVVTIGNDRERAVHKAWLNEQPELRAIVDLARGLQDPGRVAEWRAVLAARGDGVGALVEQLVKAIGPA
jgi:hypothetical protein